MATEHSIDATQAAAAVGMPARTVSHWLKKGCVAAARIGRRWALTESALDELRRLAAARQQLRGLREDVRIRDDPATDERSRLNAARRIVETYVGSLE